MFYGRIELSVKAEAISYFKGEIATCNQYTLRNHLL